MKPAGWRYDGQEWTRFLATYRSPGVPWALPAAVAAVLSLWCLKMGVLGGVDQHQHHAVPPAPAFAIALFVGIALPLLALSLYLWQLKLRSVEDPPPGQLVVTENGLWILDGHDNPLLVWESREPGPKQGKVLDSVRLTDQGAQAFYQAQTGLLRQGSYEGPVPVPASSAGSLGPELESLNVRLRETASQRARELGLSSFEQSSLRIRQLGPVTYLTATVKPLPFPFMGALAGLGCFGYATLLALALAGFTVFDPQDPATPSPFIVWIIRILAVSMLLALVIGGVRLSRLRTRQHEIRVEPDRVLLDGRPVENVLEELDLPEALSRTLQDALERQRGDRS